VAGKVDAGGRSRRRGARARPRVSSPNQKSEADADADAEAEADPEAEADADADADAEADAEADADAEAEAEAEAEADPDPGTARYARRRMEARSRVPLIAALLVGAVALLGYGYLRARQDAEPAPVVVAEFAEADASVPPDAGPVEGAPPPRAKAMEVRRLRRQVAERLREAVRDARAVREAQVAQAQQAAAEALLGAGGSGETAEPREPEGRIDPQYIRDAIESVKPLLAECYELGVDEAHRAGEAAPEGRVLVQFVFAGEPDVGGIVEESEVLADESDIQTPAIHECVRETLYTLELPAPEGGGRITVRYPFLMHPDPPEGATPN
jgi:hypothetical protein